MIYALTGGDKQTIYLAARAAKKLCAVIENPSLNTRERLSKLITNIGEKS